MARLGLDIRRFPGIRPLAADYAFAYPRVSDFFAADPADPASWQATIDRVRERPRSPERIADVVGAQLRGRSAPPEAIAAAGLLRDPNTVAIVTGQQAGLFGGPLFTLLKALTAIRLAERVRRDHQVAAVPVFWIDAEDHDWDEVRSCRVFDGDLTVTSVELGALPGANEAPVARVRLDETVADAVAALAAALPVTEHSAALLDAIGNAYHPGAGMAAAFARWMDYVLGSRGLVVFDASDAAAKSLAVDVFVQEITTAGTTARLAAKAGAGLRALGYHAQVTPSEDSVALFHLNTARDSIRQQDDGTFHIGEQTETRDALIERIRHSPAEFSPNVLLRPIVQDTLFPTVCYVAGPNELAYLGQLREVYETFGVPMPLFYQRATATILDSNAMRFLTRHDLSLELLQPHDEAVLNELLAAQLPRSVETSLQDAQRTTEERMTALATAVVQIDATLEGATRSTLTRMQDDLKKLHGKIIQAAKRKDDTLRRQFTHARAQAFPGGDPQERAVGFVVFLNKYGPALVERLNEELPLEMGTHWVVTI